nr:hypothetical protein GCM10020092_070520 [Actinoplanes digitatis]
MVPGRRPLGRTPGPGGHGLTGMRERAAMVGGSLTAGLAPIGGFLIEAVLPTTGGARNEPHPDRRRR